MHVSSMSEQRYNSISRNSGYSTALKNYLSACQWYINLQNDQGHIPDHRQLPITQEAHAIA